MDMVVKFGWMAHVMKENGNKTKHVEKVFFGMCMVILMKGIGLMIKQKDTVFTLILMEQNMKVNG